jgi:hypothetical protein
MWERYIMEHIIMNKTRIVFAALMMIVPLLSGCTDYDTNPPVITNERTMLMDVDSVEVLANPTYDHPNLLRVAPEALVQEWFKKKVAAVGSNARRFEAEVVRSSTIKNPHASSPKFDAYTTELELEMKLYEPSDNLAVMQSNMVMKLTREVARDASVPERQAFFAGMTRELVRKMDAAIPPQLQKYYGQYLRASDMGVTQLDMQ